METDIAKNAPEFEIILSKLHDELNLQKELTDKVYSLCEKISPIQLKEPSNNVLLAEQPIANCVIGNLRDNVNSLNNNNFNLRLILNHLESLLGRL